MHFLFWRLVTYLVIALFKGAGALAKEVDKSITESEAKRQAERRAESRRSAEGIPRADVRREEPAPPLSVTESIVGAHVLQPLGERHGLRWQWVKKGERRMVAGTVGNQTVYCALAGTFAEATRIRDAYVPAGFAPVDAGLARNDNRKGNDQPKPRKALVWGEQDIY